jgi:D-methionine transport system permease protein
MPKELTFMEIVRLLPQPTLETVIMTLASTFFACLMGLPLGAFLYAVSPSGLRTNRAAYGAVSRIVNILRSFPFLILIIALIPFTRFMVGTSIGPKAVVVPLSIAAAPFVARVVEAALAEVDNGVVTAAIAMGATDFQIIVKVLIPEALPALVSGLALTIINLIGYSATAGVVGGGGLGALAINYGYYRFRTGVMIGAVVVILLLVELVQLAGTLVSRSLLEKR